MPAEDVKAHGIQLCIHSSDLFFCQDNVSGLKVLFQPLRLTGTRDPRINFSAEDLARTGKVTEILDETRPGWDLEELSRIYQGTLIGAYVDHFRGKNAPVEQKALFYGVEALMEARRDL